MTAQEWRDNLQRAKVLRAQADEIEPKDTPVVDHSGYTIAWYGSAGVQWASRAPLTDLEAIIIRDWLIGLFPLGEQP